MNLRKKITFLVSISMVLLLSNCFSMPIGDGSPVRSFGILGTSIMFAPGTYTYPAPGMTLPEDGEIGSKVGTSCLTQTYLLYYVPTSVRGDMSIPAAAKAGGIKKVKMVSYQAKRPASIFGFYSIFNEVIQYCTVVHGD